MENQIIDTDEKPQTFKQSLWELVKFALIAAVLVIPIRLWIIDPFVVSGSSMVPTFQNGDYLIVDEFSYKVSSPKRDDVVVFLYPGDPKNSLTRSAFLRFFDPGKYFIKRIIGLPGETVDITGSTVKITNRVHPEGFTLDEPFVKNLSQNITHAVLANDEYFVMGDNRSGSSDSRYWGPVKKDFLTGRALLRLLPVNKISFHPGNYQQINNQ